MPSWLFDHLQVGRTARILELGCGRGDIWVENQARIPSSWDITLTDFSPGMLQDTQRRVSNLGRPFRLLVCDAQAIPFPAEQFDAVIANFMLYHVPDRPRALAEIRRVLRPGGPLYAATNGQMHLRELDQLLARFAPGRLPAPGRVGAGFTLENGADQLGAFFPNVECYRLEDGLVVTEAEPLMAYVHSTTSGISISAGGLDALAEFVRNEIAQNGAIHIAKDPGLFEAW